MFDKEEAIEKALARHQRTMEVIKCADHILTIVNFVGTDAIFLNSTDIKDLPTVLREISDKLGDYEMKRYYVDCGDRLAVVYGVSTTPHAVEVVVPLFPIKEALDKISGGKCKLVEEPSTTLGVVCGVDE